MVEARGVETEERVGKALINQWLFFGVVIFVVILDVVFVIIPAVVFGAGRALEKGEELVGVAAEVLVGEVGIDFPHGAGI